MLKFECKNHSKSKLLGLSIEKFVKRRMVRNIIVEFVKNERFKKDSSTERENLYSATGKKPLEFDEYIEKFSSKY